MTRPMQHRDVSEPIEALVREFCDQHGIAAIYHSELSRPLISHAHEILARGMAEVYAESKTEGSTHEGQSTPPTIRVIQLADHDDQMVIHIIGPFADDAARDAEMGRLNSLPLVREFAHLSASLIPPVAAEHAITPDVASRVRDGNELFEELFNS